MKMKVNTHPDQDLEHSAESFGAYGLDEPTARELVQIDVLISTESLLGDYARAFIIECARLNPLLAKEVKLKPDAIQRYCEFLVQRRIAIVDETITDYHKVRQLLIPYWIENCLAQIGRVWIRELGYLLNPVYPTEGVISFEEAREISDQLSFFEDKLEMARRVMPREREGSVDVMSLALLAAEVVGLREKRSEPRAVVMSRFLGLKMLQEATFNNIYRVTYGDLRTVTSAASTRKVWFGK